jgi:hypothetical protein
VFRTAPGISSGVWIQNSGAVEESAWSDGLRQVQRTYSIASNIEAMNVGSTDRAPQEVTLGFNNAIFAVTGLESVDIARRQVVFAPSLRQFEQFAFVDVTVSSDTSCNKASIRDVRDGRRDAPVLKGVTYVTAVISHAGGEPGTDARLTAREVRVFARHADSTQWREVIEFNVPDRVTTAAVVASRNRGYLLIGTSTGLHGEPFRLNLSSGEISDLSSSALPRESWPTSCCCPRPRRTLRCRTRSRRASRSRGSDENLPLESTSSRVPSRVGIAKSQYFTSLNFRGK